MEQVITAFSPRVQLAATTDWRDRHGDAVIAAGITAEFFAGGDEMARALAADWSIDAVVVDLALITPALSRRLGPAGPRVIAFGDPEHAGAALAANLADFISPDPTPDELADALALAVTPPPPGGVADLSDRSIGRLGALGSEATRIAAALARLTATPATDVPPPLDLVRLQGVIKARRARDRFFPPDLFGEPAWDMLLDLAVAAAEGRQVAVSSLCIAAAVPTTTALRWIRHLCDAGLFVRRNDPADARRAFVSLSDTALTAMARYLARTPQP